MLSISGFAVTPHRVRARRDGRQRQGSLEIIRLARQVVTLDASFQGVGVLVVHGGWVPAADRPGSLALWAEDPSRSLTSASRAKSRPHPFAASADALSAQLTDSSDDVRDALTKATAGALELRLPGTTRGPLPSPETGIASDSPRSVRLHAWTVPVLLVPGDAALAALGALADPAGEWTAASSLRYLCVLAGHACDLAKRGRMLPQLVAEAGVPAARWRPVLTGADAASYRDFAAAMPPVVRATG